MTQAEDFDPFSSAARDLLSRGEKGEPRSASVASFAPPAGRRWHAAPHEGSQAARAWRQGISRFGLLLLLALAPLPAHAVQPDEIMQDPGLEARARDISAELRCLVCQNQSIDDSAAPLARDLRLIVRERLKAGDSDADVRSFLVTRYGDFVLLKPPVKPETLLLWGAPLLVLALGAAGLLLRRRQPLVAAPPLSRDEEARLDALTGDARPGA